MSECGISGLCDGPTLKGREVHAFTQVRIVYIMKYHMFNSNNTTELIVHKASQ